jgi:hypothetical protein
MQPKVNPNRCSDRVGFRWQQGANRLLDGPFFLRCCLLCQQVTLDGARGTNKKPPEGGFQIKNKWSLIIRPPSMLALTSYGTPSTRADELRLHSAKSATYPFWKKGQNPIIDLSYKTGKLGRTYEPRN